MELARAGSPGPTASELIALAAEALEARTLIEMAAAEMGDQDLLDYRDEARGAAPKAQVSRAL